LSICK